MTRGGSLSDALDGLNAALNVGFETVKINTVLIGGFNDDEIPRLAELTRKQPIDLRFIELMPMLSRDGFGKDAYIPNDHVLKVLPELKKTADRGVAKLYSLPGAVGHIGLISPLSHEFCSECNRLRLTADGKLRPCLHSSTEFSIKGLDAESMRTQFEKAILAKPARHAELSSESRSQAGRDMNTIGG